MKTAGIIGGLGPETTAEFYLQLIFDAFKKNKSQRPPLLIWSVPLEYKTEKELITKAKGIEKYIPHLKDAAKRLENGGADFIVIPCNSVHLLIEEVRSAVKIPVLSIVEETSKFLKNKNTKKIALLATKATVKEGLYQKPLKENDIETILPNANDQEKIGGLINNLITSRYNDQDREKLLKIIKNFSDNGIKSIVLACTDLQLITPEIKGANIYDSMAILAKATVKEILK